MDTLIFVSYAREDQAPATSLVSFLKAAGFETWFDKDNLHAGQDWKTVIEQQIARARLVIFCLSKNSVDKIGFVQKEMRLALEQAELRPTSQVYIMPVALDGCTVPHALKRWHALDLREPKASQKLLDSIGNATGDGARAPIDDHQALSSAINSYNHPTSALQPGNSAFGSVAQEILDLIEQEPDPEQRGIVEILQEIEPGFTNFFPKIQYGGNPKKLKSRLFREAIAELISAQRLFQPEYNASTNTQTYEYKIR